MVLKPNEPIAVLSGKATRKVGQTWSTILERWFVKCPQCANIWLVVGARENEPHVCKGCGHDFVIKTSVARRERVSTEDVATRKIA